MILRRILTPIIALLPFLALGHGQAPKVDLDSTARSAEVAGRVAQGVPGRARVPRRAGRRRAARPVADGLRLGRGRPPLCRRAARVQRLRRHPAARPGPGRRASTTRTATGSWTSEPSSPTTSTTRPGSSAGTAGSTSGPPRSCSTSRTRTATARPTSAASILTGFGKDKAGEGQLNSFRWTLENRILISTGLDGGELKEPDGTTVSLRNMNVLLDPQDERLGADQRRRPARHVASTTWAGSSSPATATRSTPSPTTPATWPGRPDVPAPPAAVNILPSRQVHEAAPHQRGRAVAGPADEAPQGREGPRVGRGGHTVRVLHRGDRRHRLSRRRVPAGVPRRPVRRRGGQQPGLPGEAEAERRRCRSPSGPTRTGSSWRRSDVWFRPVQFANAPDGCLYVLDMYRELIEGAAFLAPQVLEDRRPVGRHRQGPHLADRARGVQAAAPRRSWARRPDRGTGASCSTTRTAGTATRRAGSCTSGRTRRAGRSRLKELAEKAEDAAGPAARAVRPGAAGRNST